MDSYEEAALDAEDKMEKAIRHLQDEFSGVRTGKASPNLVENLMVPYYGTPTRLREIAGIATPEARLLVINAFDPTALPAIEKAILAANLGITPKNDGRVIRIPIPELSEERRKDLTKVTKRMAEEGRVAIRNIRRDSNETIKALQKQSTISEDERDRGLDEIQKLTDRFTHKIEDLLVSKEKEIMAV